MGDGCLQVPTAGTNATQFIQLYRELIEESETKYYLVVKHDLPKYIAEIISSEIEGMQISQGLFLLLMIVKTTAVHIMVLQHLDFLLSL